MRLHIVLSLVLVLSLAPLLPGAAAADPRDGCVTSKPQDTTVCVYQNWRGKPCVGAERHGFYVHHCAPVDPSLPVLEVDPLDETCLKYTYLAGVCRGDSAGCYVVWAGMAGIPFCVAKANVRGVLP